MPWKTEDQPYDIMKPLSLSVRVLVLTISALLIMGTQHYLLAATAADGGRLVIKRSPVMADNVSVTVLIDGKPAGIVRRGGYEHYLAPGRHVLSVSPNRLNGPWHTTLDVRAGETYSYVVSFNVNKLVLTPAAKPR